MFQLPEGTPSRAETEWRALETCIQPRPVPDLRWLGRDYRGGTNLLAVELVARRSGSWKRFDPLTKLPGDRTQL